MYEGVKCTYCNRRPATYLRRESGEKLCATCLYRDLVKKVRRAFSLVDKRGVGLKVGVLVCSCRLVEGFILSKILNDIEREFQGVTVGLIAEDCLLGCANELRRYVDDVIFLPMESICAKESLNSESFSDLLSIRLDVIAIPLTLNDILAIFLRNLLYYNTVLKPWVSARSRSFNVLIPMYRILVSDIYSYALVSGMFEHIEGCSQCGEKIEIIDKLVALISMKHPELLYRFLRSCLVLLRRDY